MTGIGRSGRSRIGDAGAGSSSSRSHSSLAPGEGSQSFDSVVERMRSGPQDRGTPSASMARGADDALGDRSSGPSVGPDRILGAAARAAAAPRAATARRRGFPSVSEGGDTTPVTSQPPTSGVAVSISSSEEEINATRRHMDRLVEELDACRNAAMHAQNSEEAQELSDRFIKAGSAVLEYYARLRPAVARSILSDAEVRRYRYAVLDAAHQCNALASSTIAALQDRRKNSADLLQRIFESNATPDQLSRVASSVAKEHAACVEWWGKKLLRSERMVSVCEATANLPSTTAEMRKPEEAALRLNTGLVLHARYMRLQSRIALMQLMIESQASTFEPAVRDALMGENGGVHLLGTFVQDVYPAFLSTEEAVLHNDGAALDAEHCTVLEGVMERLSEFALALHDDILAKLSDNRTGASLPFELLGQIVDDARITAHEVMHFLALQLKTSAIIASPADAGATVPADTAGKAAAAKGTAARREGKGNRKPAADAASSAGRPEPQVAAGDSDTAPADKVLVRSDLGTKKLVSAKEAHASASSAAAHSAVWQAPASTEALAPLVKRSDELLQFDLAGQQRTVSQARQMKPEDADHVVGIVVERLQTQPAEMQACLDPLEEPGRRGLLTPAHVHEVHEKTVRLKMKLSEAQGLAKAANPESSLAPGEGSQSFDSIERMHSGPQDRRTSFARIARGADDALGDRSSGPSVGAHRILGAAPREATARRCGFPPLPEGGAPGREETSLGSDGKPWLGNKGSRSWQPDTVPPHRQTETDPGAGPGRRRFVHVAEQSFKRGYSELLSNALHDISFAGDITKFSCAVVEYDRKLQGRADHATFLQKAASEFKREFVPRWEQDIRARNTWGYATSCNTMSREAGGQAGVEACRAMAAQVSSLGNALNDVESKTLSLFVLSFSRYPGAAECCNGMIRIARFFREQRGALSELNAQSLALLVNGFSKCPEQENSREATIAVAAEIRRRAPGLSDFGPQSLAIVVNGLSKWPEDAECHGAIRAIASEVRHRAGRRDVWLSDFSPQNLATVVNGLSKWPEEAECRGAMRAIAVEVRRRAGRRDVWLADFDPQALANLVNGFSKWPQDCRDAIVQIAVEVRYRAGRRDVGLSDFDPQALANLVNGFSKWPQDCRDAIVQIADEVVHHRGDRLSNFTPQHLSNLVNGFSRWPEGVKCNDAILAIANEVRRRAGRADRLSSFTPRHLSSLVNGFSRWPERTDCCSAIIEIADEVRRRADRLSGFDPQGLANLVNGFSRWPDVTGCGDATLSIAGEVCRRADRLSGFDPQGLANLVNGFSKWPDETGCGEATLAIAGEVCRRADRLSGFDPQGLANLVNGFSKRPQEENSRHATVVIAGEVLRRADRLSDFTSQHLANLVNGFSKCPQEENSRQATVVIAHEVLRADRLSDFTPQGLANLVNGFSKWLQEQDARQATVAIANEVSRRDNRLSDFTPRELAILVNGFSKWPEEAVCHGAIMDIAGKLGSGDLRFGAFTTTQLSMIANALGRGVTRGEGTGEIIETALLKNRLHGMAHYLHYASDRLEQTQVLNIAMIFKALAKAQLFDDLGLLARTGLDRLAELHRAPGFAAENDLETMGTLCVALLPLARSPHLRWHRRRALNLLNDIQPIVEHKIEGHLKASDAERARGPYSSRCPALSIYQTLKARAVFAALFRRPYVEGKKSDLRVRQEELQRKTKEILDKTGGLVEGDLSNMSWNLMAEIAAESPVDALDTFLAQNAATVQAQHPASVFDVHQVLRTMAHEPRPPQGDAGLMQLSVVDMQGRPVATEPETRYSIFHRLTSGVLPVVAVQLPGKPSAFMLARTVTVQGVPYRMDLFGGSKLKPPKKPVSQIAGRLPGVARAESSGGKLLAIPYAETAPGTAFEQLSRAWAPFKEAYYYTQRRGFAAPPAIKELGPRDYALEGAFKLSLLPDRPASEEHPFKLTGPEGPIALRPHDGCGFIKASLANRMPAVNRARRQEGPDRVPAFAEGRRMSVPASALQHYPRSEPVTDEAREKAKTWLESRQGRELTSEELFRTVTAGHIDGPGAVAVPSSDDCLHVPTLKSETLMGASGVLIGRSPYDKPNLRPFAAERVKSAVEGDPTAVFLENCTAIQYSFNVAQKSGKELAGDDPTFFAKGILMVVPDKMWPAGYADRGLVLSAEDVKCHSSWTSSKDRAKVDTPLECVGILQATEVFAPGSLVAVPIGEQKKLDGDFDGDTVVIVGDRPQLYEHVRQFDRKEQALGLPSLKPPKSHTPALEGDNYQFGRARQILAATQDVLGTYSCLQRNFLAQSHEAQRWFAERAVFGTYEGVHHELRREIRQLLGQEEVSSQDIQNTFARARSEIEVAKHLVAREMAELLVDNLAAWAVKPNEQPLPEIIESSNAANPSLSARLCNLFPDLAETYPATPQPRDRIQLLLDHYPARIDPRPDGYNADDLVKSANNLLSLGIKVGTDAYKSDTGANLFFQKSSHLQRLLYETPGLKSVPYVKGVAATLARGRFDVDATLEDLRDNPTLAASIMETSIKLAAEQGILRKPSGLRPAADDADMITLTREQASERAQNEAGRAIAEERKITAAAREVAGILAQAGIEVKMPHLERRLKSHASMTDQLTGMSIPPSSAPQLFSNAVRHVLEIPDKDFTRAFKKAMLAFEERDYTERQTTNWFRMRSPTFVGIKTVLTTADSYRFEVEFHTPGSYQAKLANHDSYKILGRLRRQSREDALEQAEAEKLVQRTREVCTEIAIPDGALGIPHWGAEGDRKDGAAAAFGLRAFDESRMPEIAGSTEAREIIAATCSHRAKPG
ncbi:XopAD/skwp family type III secretion system effector [Bradyrhizobium sp. 87]|uniref:XopAD/skwp family type III secretion system effector n=1 Tax=Bradyrhizobium sp. 87 TaxID=2782682 RepID=UPI003211DFFD